MNEAKKISPSSHKLSKAKFISRSPAAGCKLSAFYVLFYFGGARAWAMPAKSRPRENKIYVRRRERPSPKGNLSPQPRAEPSVSRATQSK